MDRNTYRKAGSKRDEKRERFDTKTASRRRTPWIMWGALAIVLLAGGTVGLMRLLPGAEDPLAGVQNGLDGSEAIGSTEAPGSPVVAPSATTGTVDPPELDSLVAVAATSGHAAYPLAISQDETTIRFPVSEFADGAARHYTYMYGSQPIEFFVLESRDGVIRAAFNACDVCYGAKLGYHQSGDLMVCANCGRRFASNRINVVQGGCNPAPLDRRIEGDYLVIDVEDIVRGYRFF